MATGTSHQLDESFGNAAGGPARTGELRILGLAGATALALSVLPAWWPWLGFLDYPFRLLLTLVHELGHGLAAILTGGRFDRFVIYPDGSGLAYTAGGWRFVVIPAGYLGAAAFGAGLLVLGRDPRRSRWALGGLGAAMALLSLRYGVPSIASEPLAAVLLTTTAGVVLGGFFVWLAVVAGRGWILFAVHLVAIEAGLTATADLWTLVGLSTRIGGPVTDARAMAELTLIPAFIWANFWILCAVILFGAAIRFTWLRRR